MSEPKTIAVLGAGGTMGLPMAGNIAKAGFGVRAWNRTREKAEPLAADGIEVCDTPAAAASGADLLLTMLSDADAVLAALEGDDGALASAQKESTWLQMSTIGIEGTERCADIADANELTFFDAPVLGTKAPAEKGELVVLASGPQSDRDLCEPLFDAVGKKTLWLGDVGAGTKTKLVVNAWIVSVVEGLAETVAFAEGIGVDPSRFLEAIEDGPLDLPYAHLKGKAMIERSFEPSFKLELAAKDARLVLEAAVDQGLDLPMLETIKERMSEAAAEHGDKDLAATFLASAPEQRG